MRESKIATALDLKYFPVAILWSDEKPEGALGFKEGKWRCFMWMQANAAKGRVATFLSLFLGERMKISLELFRA